MKLVVPYIGELRDLDARLVRLAEFLGIRCETLALANVAEHAAFLEETVPDQRSCFVVNTQVMKEWVGLDGIPSDLVAFLLSRFPHMLVHGLRVDAFDTEMVAALSRGKLKSVDAVDGGRPLYVIAKDSRHVCEAFSGLSFGPVNPVNDHVFCTSGSDPAVEQLISIGGRPFMAAVRAEGTEILFVASEDVADLNEEVGDTPLAEYFSRFLPHAMALRYIFGEESWRPCAQHASVIIDDPLLRRNYGFLNFESLLGLMNQHNFHTTVAFIPHNFRRSSPRITRTFRENAGRFGLCYHGNDHTGAEFASTDTVLLNTMLQVAEQRMNLHAKMTGIKFDRVMVFPQGNFSVEAMSVLKSRNFDSAVNSVAHPTRQPARLTLGEMAQPAVLRYDGFPLFLRKCSLQTQSADIAFHLFFGKPVLIVEHHDIFQHPESLIEAVKRVNAAAPEIQWSNLGSAVAAASLIRRAPDAYNVRAFSRTVRVLNESGSTQRFLIEWRQNGQGAAVEQVLKDGMPCVNFEADDSGTRLAVDLAPGSSQTFSVVYRNTCTTLRSLGFRRKTRAYLRRRLSEVRDNYLSKNPAVLSLAKSMHSVLSKTPTS